MHVVAVDSGALWGLPLRELKPTVDLMEGLGGAPRPLDVLPSSGEHSLLRRAGSAVVPSASAATSSRRSDGVPPGGQALRYCQVPGCASPGAEPRSYLGRCRLCMSHMKAETLDLGGELLRFCQKYGNFFFCPAFFMFCWPSFDA